MGLEIHLEMTKLKELKNMKFDYVIQNPPYSGDTHLKFFEAGLNILKKDGKMIIIEPSTWFIQLKENAKYTKDNSLSIKLKKRIEGHVSKIVIENYNKEFNIANTVPFSVTYIDNSKEYKTIKYQNFGIKKYVNSLHDCNLIGNIETIKSIFEKIKNYDVVDNHIINEQLNDNNIYYCQLSAIIWTICGLYNQRPQFALSDTAYYKHKFGQYFQSCLSSIIHISRNEITNIIPCKAARGGSSKGKVKLTNNPAKCVTGTKQELENWKYYVFNNSLPLFINICMTIDQQNNSLPYVPWLVDKKYTDQEIYDKFGFTEEEIKLIEMTIKKYERYSPWFKRYMCGPSSVSDEEVQKFIDELENA